MGTTIPEDEQSSGGPSGALTRQGVPEWAGTLRVSFLAGTLGRGGAERQLVHMARVLRQAGVSVRVLCLTTQEAMEAELLQSGVPVTWVGQPESRLVRVRQIIRALRVDPPDILQSAHFYTNIYVSLAGARLGVPSIGAVRNDVRSELQANRPLGRAQLLMPRFLIANSRLGWERAIKGGRHPRRTFLVENALDVERLAGAVRLEGPRKEPRRFRLLFVGRLTAQKRPDIFLRLVRNLEAALPGVEVHARLVGSGPQEQLVRTLLRQMGLDPSRIRLEGEQGDLVPFYRWADVLVLTSDHEGTPNVILEAMAARVPVVATAVGGVPDLVVRGDGLLVRPDNEAELLRSVARLFHDPHLRETLADRAYRYVVANHSLSRLAERLFSVYRVVLGR